MPPALKLRVDARDPPGWLHSDQQQAEAAAVSNVCVAAIKALATACKQVRRALALLPRGQGDRWT
ncbi:hypothetical protein [Xanthomonas euroxanthea]|uniref:hypothetical protein n=1 Tax=Xanthomonas euroxanthea TaxID=2259622 RepID=UPI00141ADF04|nr:hypothetical protein [Xanthomonas euroxanthea]